MTQNPYVTAVATLYEQTRYEEALSKVEKALEWPTNGPREVLFLKLMKGVLQAELGQGGALESFNEALALDAQAALPVRPSWRLRKLFEQARNSVGLAVNEEQLTEDWEPSLVPWIPPPRRLGLSVSLRGEVDVLGLGTAFTGTPAVGVNYSWEREGCALTLLTQASPGLRAEVQFHPLLMGWVRPYARAGTTAFFRVRNEQGDGHTFLGGMSGRVAAGLDWQWSSRMYAFSEVAYERFVIGSDRYRPDSVLFSLGVGLFP
ncbi:MULTISPECIES: hypothetical protein [unclassified Corallococcus]|uniref:hypothetical protein n=1 Tax=unclassified Corallococcus TaxID=2685029 RepID=UPI001A8C1ADB|nr:MULTISPECIES: hypothetical protein [unclassified Corallococcus]MBN9684344.1 hypothetical protein [Corallococcus sp. NCSPR001]WAS84177.1 hypothetical protein O0N60_33415 [Corallococcus sp. NCRR]